MARETAQDAPPAPTFSETDVPVAPAQPSRGRGARAARNAVSEITDPILLAARDEHRVRDLRSSVVRRDAAYDRARSAIANLHLHVERDETALEIALQRVYEVAASAKRHSKDPLAAIDHLLRDAPRTIGVEVLTVLVEDGTVDSPAYVRQVLELARQGDSGVLYEDLVALAETAEAKGFELPHDLQGITQRIA